MKINAFTKPLIWRFRKHSAKYSASRLASHSNSSVRAIGDALHASLTGELTEDESVIVDQIEARRIYLMESKKSISVIDFGASSPEANRSREEMQKGRRSITTVADICSVSKSPFWGTLLLKLIEELQPVSCVELGSCVGISAAYQAAGMKINGTGGLVTLEGSPEVADLAKQTLETLGLKNVSVVTGPFHQTLSQVLESSAPIGYFFNDGHHDYDAVLEYYHASLPYLSDQAVVVFDDISWSVGMRKAWEYIESHEKVFASFDLKTMGIALISNDTATKEKFRIPL